MQSQIMNIVIKYPFILYFLVCVFAVHLNAKEVSEDKALIVAQNFVISKPDYFLQNQLTLSFVHTEKHGDEPLYYVFNIENGGFIIVSAEDRLTPILGYSFNEAYIINHQKSNFTGWMQQYKNMILGVRQNDDVAPLYINEAWQAMLDSGTVEIFQNKYPGEEARVYNSPDNRWEVEPLIRSNWDQDIPYNMLTPDHPDGPGGRCVTGCVATALSQIMHYWRYPLVGSGSKSYVPPGYGLLTADFGNTYYKWNAMKDELSNISGSASIYSVSLLQYHVGIAVEMNFEPDGSSSTNTKALEALKTYFNYAPAVSIAEREFYDPNTWAAILKNNLDNGRPVFYAADNGETGHAFVCDGYQTGEIAYFHFNFGWGGSNNGYYSIDDPFGYTNGHSIIRNIYPDYSNYTYPYFCDGPSYLTVPSGSFTDGSGPVESYKSNTSCSWYIIPQNDSVTYFTIGFDQFEIGDGDTLTIYDGLSFEDAVLGTFSNGDLPEEINTSGDEFMVSFVTDGQNVAEGWQIDYKGHLPDYCDGIVNLSDANGTIRDGSGSKNYAENTLCRWKIEIPDADKITFGLTELNTEEKYDYIHVHDLSTDPASELGKFSGNSIPEPVTGQGPLLITWRSNNCINNSGWKAYYTNGEAGINESTISNLNVYPNPASDILHINYQQLVEERIKLEITNCLGIVVKRYNFDSQAGNNIQDLSVSDLKAGIYLLHLTHKKGSSYKRIIIL